MLVNRGVNLANMVTYTVDLSEWKGQKLYIRITDNASDDWGLITADSFVTYYEEGDVARYPLNPIEAINILDRGNPTESKYQVENGSFEKGNIDGWELSGNIGNISYDYLWWNEWYTFNKDGLFFFSGFAGSEGDKGTLTSSVFEVGGAGIITYRLGGGRDTSLCYIDVVDAEDENKIYYRFGNEKFTTAGGVYTGVPVTVGCSGFGANMVLYKADISDLSGKKVRLRITDNASSDWGLIFADDFVTYYENESLIPADAVKATNIPVVPEFKDVTQTLNLAHGNNTVTLNPATPNAIYEFTFEAYADEENADELAIDDNIITVVPNGELNTDFNKVYEIEVHIALKNTLTGEESEQIIYVTLTAMFDNRQLLNGGFETGDLTGWTVVKGEIKVGSAVSGDETFWGEHIPTNQGGSFHFDGWGAQNAESDTYALRSSKFTLDGSGFISFKMAGRSAVLKVYKADGEQIAEYENTEFANVSFPHVDEGCRLATMTTFVADLSDYIGEELYIEICDVATDMDWAVVFFDDIVTYYETAPDTANSSDTLKLNSATSSTGEECDYELKWVTAENKLKK